MKLSAKSRYALVALIKMAMVYETHERTTLNSLSEHLKISKVYLEQVFSLLKHSDLVSATKGAQGGYLLNKPPHELNVYEVLNSVEPALFAQNNQTVQERAPNLEITLKHSIFDPLDTVIKETLSSISLSSLVQDVEKNSHNYMYYL